MRTVPADLVAAITSPERTIRATLSVDWDGDGHGPAGSIDDLSAKAASISVSRDFTKTLPVEVLVVEGTGASTARADLVKGDTADERLGAVQYFSRFNPASPLFGKTRASRDVRLAVEFLTASGWQSVPRMTRGVLRNLPVSVGKLSAELQLLDARDRFRTPIDLPVMIAEPADPTADTRPGLEASWLVSYLMWRCGFPLSPPPPVTPAVWVPCHGSTMPFLQRANGGSPQAYLYDPATSKRSRATFTDNAPFFLAADVGPNQTGLISSFLNAASPPSWVRADGRSNGRIEIWIRPGGTYTTDPLSVQLQTSQPHTAELHLTSVGVLQLILKNNGVTRTVNGPTITFDGTWRRIGVHWDDNAGRAVFIVGGVTTLVTFTPTTASAIPIPDDFAWICIADFPFAEILYTTTLAEAAPWQPLTWSSGAEVDRLQNRQLAGIYPASTAPEAWSLLGAILGAEQGLAWIDYDGKPRIWSRARLAKTPALTSQVTLTARSSIFDLAYDDSRDMIRNIIRVPFKQLTLKSGFVIFAADTIISLQPGERRTWDIVCDPIASYAIQWSATAAFNSLGAGATVNVGRGWDQGVSSTVTILSQTSVRLETTNDLGQTVYFCDYNGGDPAIPNLRVTADVLTQADGLVQEFRNGTSIAKYGDKTLDVPASEWRQTINYAKGQAAQLGALLREEQVVFTALDVPGDPRLEPWDRVTVQDDAGLQVTTPLTLEAITDKIDTRFDQTLVARPARALWILGGPGVGTPLGDAILGG